MWSLGRPMFYLGMCLFEKHNLIAVLHLDNAKVMKFLCKQINSMLCVCMYMCYCSPSWAVVSWRQPLSQWYPCLWCDTSPELPYQHREGVYIVYYCLVRCLMTSLCIIILFGTVTYRDNILTCTPCTDMRYFNRILLVLLLHYHSLYGLEWLWFHCRSMLSWHHWNCWLL